MRALFFDAAARHPKVTVALMGQAWNVLRPFNRFLEQAIHTAKQRQVRYQLPWERVRNLQSVRLKAIDTIFRVPRRSAGFLLVDWPAGRPHDLKKRGFVLTRDEPLSFSDATETADGLLVQTDNPLFETDRVAWCNIQSSVKLPAAPMPPERVKAIDGRLLKRIGTPRIDEGGRHWLLVLEGEIKDEDLVVDGEEVSAVLVSAKQDLTRVVDALGTSFNVEGGILRVDALPAKGLLKGDNQVRFDWEAVDSTRRSGCWVQLLPPKELFDQEFLDPRAAFCEGGVEEVWTDRRRSAETIFRVSRVDQDRYQLLLERYPPDGSVLHLPIDLRNLYLQKRALRQLSAAPLPHHDGLLRLCEDPAHAHWARVEQIRIPEDEWRSLTSSARSGTEEQREFVKKALGSPDFAFLEGPPGSGKTTAICELVQQLIGKGKRVLLCASTHVAIDNVLERILDSKTPLDALRIGKLDRVDDRVKALQLDERRDALVKAWRNRPDMTKLGESELHEMAERVIVMAANLTCGTTMGIIGHPLFRGRDEDLQIWERPITTMPHWDVLIVDESSKTLIQEFMVPALMAKRWIVVGDVRQLPPFTDQDDIKANLRDLVDEDDHPVFPPEHQRACLLVSRLRSGRRRQPGMRWLIVEPPQVLDWIERELEADPIPDLSGMRVGKAAGSSKKFLGWVDVSQLQCGDPQSLRVAAADWILVDDELITDVASWLPSNILLLKDLSATGVGLAEGSPLLMRQAAWREAAGGLPEPYEDKDFQYRHRRRVISFSDAQDCEANWLRERDLASELTWRLTRRHELRRSKDGGRREHLKVEIDRLLPRAVSIDAQIGELEDIGLPSILEVLQDGIGEERASRRSVLTEGLRNQNEEDFRARFTSLSFQHRMHPDIAEFPREVVYDGHALRDANTIDERDRELGWDFGEYPSRRVWFDVEGNESNGVNPGEIEAMEHILRDFIDWAAPKGGPRRKLPRVWEVACLSFYAKQERAISDMLRRVTGDARKTRFSVRDNHDGEVIEFVCGTVDRFQGREADLVLLSMRNTRRIGFLNSPNRLNVAVTRARQQLVVIGNYGYFKECDVSELRELASRTPTVALGKQSKWRRGRI
jgi:hypothetical protein